MCGVAICHQVVVFHHGAVVETEAVVIAAAVHHGCFFQQAVAGGGLAGVEQLAVRVGYGLHVSVGHGGHTREALDEIQCSTLGAQNGAGRALNHHYNGSRGYGFAIMQVDLYFQAGIHRAEYGFGYFDAGQHTLCAGAHQGACLQALRHEVGGGNITIAKIFIERQLNERFHIVRYFHTAHAHTIEHEVANVKAEMKASLYTRNVFCLLCGGGVCRISGMARMFPAEFPVTAPYDAGQVGERIVYEALQQLPADWTVIYNCWRHLLVDARKRKSKHITYEADFVLLIPGCGVMVLEVKNWQSAKVENGRWLRGTPSGYVPVGHDSPLNQAFLAMKNLRAELDKYFRWGHDGRSRLETRCMAVLLGKITNYENLSETEFDADAVEAQWHDLNASVPRNEVYDRLYLCGAEALGAGLQKRVESLFCFGNGTTPAELDEVRRYLLQNLVFRMDAATATAIINSAAAPLTQVLPMLAESPVGVHVEGCAGSGKSTMLCCEAARLALHARQHATRSRVLVTCFNYNLAEYLRVQGAMRYVGVQRFDGAASFALDNFQTIVEQLCKLIGMPMPGNLFVEGALAPLIEAVQGDACYACDYIFVDEAQDFPSEWWRLLQCLLKPGGKLYIFSDKVQRIFGRGCELPTLPVRLRLQHNLRNSSPIASFSASICQGAPAGLPLQGPAVEVMPPGERAEQRAAAVRAAIETLLRENYALHDIVVLTPWRRNTSLKDPLLADLVDFPADGETRENADLRLSRCLAPGSTRVLGETVKAYKGLESLAVILTDVSAPRPGPDSGFTPNELYVACTRARFRLIIVPTPGGAEYLDKVARV